MAGPKFSDLLKAGGKIIPEEDSAPSDDGGYDDLPPYQEPEPLMSYSPEAALRAQKAAEIPDVGETETFFTGLTNAMPPGAARLRDMFQAVADRDVGERARLTPQAREELERLGPIETPGLPAEPLPQTAPEPPSILDNYRVVRDSRNERGAVGAELNPWADRLGTGAGIGLSVAAPLPGVRVPKVTRAAAGAGLAGRVASSPVAQRVASGVATGAAYGALGGATDGPADLTRGDVGGTVGDALRGGAQGAVWGAGGAAVGEGVRKYGPDIMRYLARVGARYNIQGNSDIAAATRKPMRDESVDQILDDDVMLPWSTTKQTYERIAVRAEEEGAELGRIVAALEKRGVKGPDANALAAKLLARSREEWARNLNPAESAVFSEAAEAIRQRGAAANRPPSDVSMPTGTAAPPGARQPQPRGPNGRFLKGEEKAAALAAQRANEPPAHLGFAQTEAMKSNAQRQARFDRINTTGLDEARQEIASTLRQANEDQVTAWASEAGRGRGDKIMAGKFKRQKGVTGNYLDAMAAAERGASKEVQRSPVGLKDTIIASSLGLDPITAQAAAAMNGGIMRRIPSTVAHYANRSYRALQNPGVSEDLARGFTEAVPLAAREVERRVDDETLEKVARATPEQLGEYAEPIRAAMAQGKDRLRAVDKVLRDTDPKYRQMRQHLGTAYIPD